MPSLQLLNHTMIVSCYIHQSLLFCKLFEVKNSKGFVDILFHGMPGHRQTTRQANVPRDKFRFSATLLSECTFTISWQKNDFPHKLDLPTPLTTLEAMKSHAGKYGVSTTTIQCFGCEMDQVNWREVAKLLLDVFASLTSTFSLVLCKLTVFTQCYQNRILSFMPKMK